MGNGVGRDVKLPNIAEIEELINTVALKDHQKYYCCNENCVDDYQT